MQEPTLFAGVPGAVPPASQLQHTSTGLRSKLVLFLVPVLVIALVAGGFTWLQWSSQRGIELGYPPPEVQITSTLPGQVLVNGNLQFSANGTGRDLTYDWDFGDQSTASGQIVSHAYQSSGDYTVTVTVTDAIGHTSTQTTNVHVLAQPSAQFNYNEEYYYYGQQPTEDFNASSSTTDSSLSIVKYTWDFGDQTGDTTTSPYDSHTYTSSGTYNVTLTITDSAGQQNSTTISVTLY